MYSGRRKKPTGNRYQPTMKEIATFVSIRQKRNCPGRPSRLANRKGTTECSGSVVRPIFPQNLAVLEPHFQSRSTDSETMEADAAIGTENGILKSGVQQNPMDFEYFEKLVRSEDEARHQVILKLIFVEKLFHPTAEFWQKN